MTEKSKLKAAMSVSEMCRFLDMSRSQFYWHARRGTFHKPLYMARNNRPFFTESMAEENLRAKESGIGIDGQYVIFYNKTTPQVKDVPEKMKPVKQSHSNLLPSLRTLGLDNVTTDQVKSALATCFPDGTDDTEESKVLRDVFRHLKRSEAV